MLLEPLLEAGMFDPIAGCLGAHLRIKERQTDHLASLGELMAETLPTLPDSHLLVGLNHEAAGRTEQAAGCYRTALGHGLPVTASLTRSLSGGVARLEVEHTRATARAGDPSPSRRRSGPPG